MKSLERLPWHSALWKRIEEARSDDRLPQAMLLAGARGVGKKTFARQLAALLLCESPMPPCGNCRGCQQSGAGTHPDGLMLSEQGLFCLSTETGRQGDAVPVWTPDKESKRQDIGVNGIRALIDRLTLTSHYGQPRIAVIAPADALNRSGANMLLKTIEEPPPNVYLVLVAERWRYLPATLRSRCQLLRFSAPAPEVAGEWLRKAYPKLKDSARASATRRPLHAVQLSDPKVADRQDQWASALAKLPKVGRGQWPIMKIQKMTREEARAGLECWLETVNHWLRQRLAGEQPPGGVSPVPAELSADQLSKLYEVVVDGMRRLDRNANPALVVESIIIRGAGIPARENHG